MAPPFSSSSGVLGNGLCELDRLLQELNATQFNITGTRVTKPVFDGLGTGQRRAESRSSSRTQSLCWEGGLSMAPRQCRSLVSPDEIMSQFPSSKMAEGEGKEDQSEDKSITTV